MKKCLLLSIILISLLGCKESQNQNIVIPPKPVNSIDTIKVGNIGEPKSSLTIITRLDTTIIKRISKYWASKSEIYERFEFFDSLGNKYKQVDFDNDKDGFKHSYVWRDTLKVISKYDNIFRPKTIARIDSSFGKNGKVKEIKQKYGDTDLTENFNSKNVIEKKRLYSKRLTYMFLQQGNSFYKIRTDIPFEYAERIPATKTDFGEALNLFYQEKNNSENRYKELFKLPLE